MPEVASPSAPGLVLDRAAAPGGAGAGDREAGRGAGRVEDDAVAVAPSSARADRLEERGPGATIVVFCTLSATPVP